MTNSASHKPLVDKSKKKGKIRAVYSLNKDKAK